MINLLLTWRTPTVRPPAAHINLIVAAIAMVATLPGRTQGLGLVTGAPSNPERKLRTGLFYTTVRLLRYFLHEERCMPGQQLQEVPAIAFCDERKLLLGEFLRAIHDVVTFNGEQT